MSLSAPSQWASQALENPQRDFAEARRSSAEQTRSGDHWLKGDVRGRTDCHEASHRDGQRRQTAQRIFVPNAIEIWELPRPLDQRSQHATFPPNRCNSSITKPLEQHLHAVPLRSAADLLQERFIETHKLHLQRANFPGQLSHSQPTRRQNVWSQPEECFANVLWDTRQVVWLLLPIELEQAQIPQHIISRTSVLWSKFVCIWTCCWLGRWKLIRWAQRARVWRAGNRCRSAIPSNDWKCSLEWLDGVAAEAAKVQRHFTQETAEAFERGAVTNHYRLQSLNHNSKRQQTSTGKLV